MCVKEQILTLCKLSSSYEEVPEEFWDETDVNRFFLHNTFDVSQSHRLLLGVGEGSHKKSFTLKLFHVCDLKTQQRYILQEMNISNRELSPLVDSLRDSSKLSIKQASVYKFHCRNSKFRLDLEKWKTISWLNTKTISLNI